MALTGSENVARSRMRIFAAMLARVRAWAADGSDRSLAQRTAGTAFLIRVASAGLLYLSPQVGMLEALYELFASRRIGAGSRITDLCKRYGSWLVLPVP